MSSKTLKAYRAKIREAMQEPFQRKALENFTTAYWQGREKNFSGMDLSRLVQSISGIKDDASGRLMELFQQFCEAAEARGVRVHLARTAREANDLVEQIAEENGCKKIVKSKSMTAEETLLNHYLERHGLEVTETDLGEWIIQLRDEGPSHMVMPAIHLSRDQVKDLFTQVTGRQQDRDIETLVKVARRELRQRFVQADMGITGANFAIAQSGTLGIVTNEGNARLVTTLPRVHVVFLGMDKLTASLDGALTTLNGLSKNATGQAITSYVTWITGANECQVAPEENKIVHVIFLDNGRLALSRDAVFSQALRCVRCGACANVCPIYRLVGGHKYGHIYIGAIGLILTYFFHGKDMDKNLIQNCLNCQACKDVCIAGIDLPRLIKEVQVLIQEQDKHPFFNRFVAALLKNRKMFHSLLRTAKSLQKPVSWGGPYLRHLPHFLLGDQDFKALPALASQPFRDKWKDMPENPKNPSYNVALFTGCLQDFVYPEQLEKCVQILTEHNVAVHLPLEQGCCGLPAYMLGEKEAAREVALHNLSAIDPAYYDYVLTLCASCGSHLKENYPGLIGAESGVQVKTEQFTSKVIDLASLLYSVLGLQNSALNFSQEKTAYHAPCHLCRGMGVKTGPRELLRQAGINYQENREEENCCGLGGTYSTKFPEISKEIMNYKLDYLERDNFQRLVTDCPGCILQLRGGAKKRNSSIQVVHLVEALR